jgi:hypothetical protein
MGSKLLLFLMAATSLHAAGDSALDRATLRGLTAVNVVVDPVEAQVEEQGVTRAKLRARVEDRLHAANITVDSSSSEFVGVRLTSVRAARGRFAVSQTPFAVAITIALYQPVQLVRDPNVRTATQTWEVETVVLADPKVLYRACEESIDDLAARFVAAFRSVNPEAAK